MVKTRIGSSYTPLRLGILFSVWLVATGCGDSATPSKSEGAAVSSTAPAVANKSASGKRVFTDEPSAREKRAARLKAAKDAGK
jgi:hypothetical protein